MKPEQRYSGKLVDDYKLLRRAWPHRIELFERMSEYALEYHRIVSDDKPIRILEAGCGDCEALEILLDSARSQDLFDRIRVDAVDLSPQMIDRARDRLAYGALSKNVNFYAQDITTFLESKLPKTYDFVMSSWTIHNFSQAKRSQTVNEIGRTLRDYGQFVWMDKIFPDVYDEDALRLVSENFARYHGTGLIQNPNFKAFITHEFNDIADGQRLEEAEVGKLLKDAGFRSFAFDKAAYKREHCFEKIFCANK